MRGLILIITGIIFLAILSWYVLPKAPQAPTPEPQQKSMTLTITSPAFETNGVIPARFTCDGKNISPPLTIHDIPKNAVSLALIMEDPDVPKHIREDGMWDHWIVFNIPPTTTNIEESSEPHGVHGITTSKKLVYGGPCPPDREHHYFFKLFALNTMLTLPEGSTKHQVLDAMRGHIIDETTLMGTYERIKK